MFGIHLLQFDRNRDVEQCVFVFVRLLGTMGEQAAAECPSKVHQGPTLADRALLTLAVADHFAIETEDCVYERKKTGFRLVGS